MCIRDRIYDYLCTESPYEKDELVEGTVYQMNPSVGLFVAVENKYHGMIPAQNVHGSYRVGDTVKARVVKVRDDGKLELSTQDRVEVQMDRDAEIVMEVLESYDGILPFSEKASPEVIERELDVYKRQAHSCIHGKRGALGDYPVRRTAGGILCDRRYSCGENFPIWYTDVWKPGEIYKCIEAHEGKIKWTL